MAHEHGHVHGPDCNHGHAHKHDHAHDHKHDHSHAHSHDHEHHHHGHSDSDYFLEQLLSIFICGAFGIVAVLMYSFNRLNEMLVPAFHLPVLLGGSALLVFTGIRAIAVWAEAGKLAEEKAHSHESDHVHGPDCDHSHDHAHAHSHGHSHSHGGHSHDDHGHDHGGIFWRIVVLSFPILLFLMGLPNEGFSKEWIERRLGKDAELGNLAEVQTKDDQATVFDFNELSIAAHDPARRALFEGRKATLIGQYKQVAPREFTLFVFKMTCCAADQIPLKARIVASFVPYAFKFQDWVEVTGVIQFVEDPNTKQYIPVIRVQKESDIKKTAPRA